MGNLSGLFSNATQTGQRMRLLHVEQQEVSGTGSGTFTSGVWQTRILNTAVTNEITGASLSSNQITLPAGKYIIEASAPAFKVNNHKTKLYNVTDASDVAFGSTEETWATDNTSCRSFLATEITLSDAKVFEFQHRCITTYSAIGFGPSTAVLTGTEVFAVVKIWQVLDSRTLPHQAELLHVEDQKANNVHGGTFTNNAWRTREFTAEATNQVEGASLAANQIILPAGRYLVEGHAPGYRVDAHQSRLYNVSDSSILLVGTCEYSRTDYLNMTRSSVSGIITLTGQKTLELQHYGATTFATLGFGVASGRSIGELYSVIKFWKLS